MLEKGNKVFGEWMIDEEIGSGAFGTVYKIKREEFGEEYFAALKVINIPQDSRDQMRLRSEGMDNESINTYYGQLVQNFIQEIKLLSSLDGITNIVDYKDHCVIKNGELGYTIYIKMQLLTPLSKKLLDVNGNAVFLTTQEILTIGTDICSALMVCEKNKILHRDIKIDNIFVSANGDYKLGDFGIAKQLESTQGEMSKKGTMMYMAPEVFRGENYNNTADIYSLGIVLYRLLNKNRAPFFPLYPLPIKFSDKEVANIQRLNGAILPDINGVNADFMAVLRKACAFNPAERYQSATEFKSALEKITVTEPVDEFLSDTAPLLDSDVFDAYEARIHDADSYEVLYEEAPVLPYSGGIESLCDYTNEDTLLFMDEDNYAFKDKETFDALEDRAIADTEIIKAVEDKSLADTEIIKAVEDKSLTDTEIIKAVEDKSLTDTEIIEPYTEPGECSAESESKMEYDDETEVVYNVADEYDTPATDSSILDEEVSKEFSRANKLRLSKIFGVLILVILVPCILLSIIPIDHCDNCNEPLYIYDVECSYCLSVTECSHDGYAYTNIEPLEILEYESDGYYIAYYEYNEDEYYWSSEYYVYNYGELYDYYDGNIDGVNPIEDISGVAPESENVVVNLQYYQYRWCY